MKLNVLCTAHGLVPVSDDDFDEKKRLKIGQVYECDVKVQRNVKFLRKAFALLNTAWALMDERQQAAWRSKQGFRDYLTVAAGYYDVYYNPRLQQFVEQPKSWSFDSMDEAEFSSLYDRLKDVIFRVLGDKINEDIFNNVLINF